MTQEQNPLGDLLGGIEKSLGEPGAAGATGGNAAAANPISEIMGLLQSAPGAGTAQATGQSIDPNVVKSVLGLLGGGSSAASGTSAPGNPAALIDQLKAGGLASEVESWIGTGANKPVSPEALGQALGPQTVQQLSSSSGLSIPQLLPQLAALIPLIINHLTPNGSASGLSTGSGAQALGGLQSLLGSLENR